jgi:eukaryotic-like serine/threonine-protein kinase
VAHESGSRLGPYEILGPLGAGGMGEVYRARDTRLDRLVAIKVLPGDATSPHSLERFEREAKSIAALNHPGICAVYDVGTAPVAFLVMELLEGETLQHRLTRGALDVPALVDTGLALADALAGAHAKGIVHRDLKPANIILTARGPKILDFGLARIVEDLTPDITAIATLPAHGPLTGAGVAVGTVAYMSPEQLRAEPLDPRTDLFSLGLVLYEMATGKRAFAGTTSAVTSAAILHDQPAAPRQLRPDLPPRLEQAIVTLLEKDREVRTQTASELRAEMTRLKRELSGARAPDASYASQAGVPTVTSTTVASPIADPSSSSDAQLIAGVMGRHRRLAGVLAVTLVLGLGAAYFLGRTSPAPGSSDDAPRVSIAQLQIEQLTTSGSAGLPAISPDGKYVAYVELSGGIDSLRVRQVATGSNVEIVPGQPGVRIVGPTVTPDGAFVTYVKMVPPQPPELWEIPFLGGAPRRVLQGIGGRVDYSPDGTQVAFGRTTGPGRTEVVITGANGGGAKALAERRIPHFFLTAAAAPGLFSSFAPSWSPDGKTLAVLGGRARAPDGARDSGQIVFLDTQTGAEKMVKDVGPPLVGAGLAWLDERWLVLSMLDRSSAPMQLWLLSFPDGEFRRLSNDLSQYIGVSLTGDRDALVTSRAEFSFDIWTSDASATRWSRVVPETSAKGPIGFGVEWLGDDLVYVASNSSGFALMRWHTATKTAERLVASAGDPAVSRDGSTIAFFDYDTGEQFTMDASGQNRTLVNRGFGQRAWLTADGRSLLRVAPGSGGAPVLRLDAAGGNAREVTADRVALGPTGLSPDGRLVAFTTTNDRNQPAIAVCELPNCTDRRTLPAQPTRWHWMPDSRALAYVEPRTSSDIWVQPVDGGAPRQLTRFPSDGRQIADFAWSADGQRIAVARSVSSSNIVLFRGLRPTAPTR